MFDYKADNSQTTASCGRLVCRVHCVWNRVWVIESKSAWVLNAWYSPRFLILSSVLLMKKNLVIIWVFLGLEDVTFLPLPLTVGFSWAGVKFTTTKHANSRPPKMCFFAIFGTVNKSPIPWVSDVWFRLLRFWTWILLHCLQQWFPKTGLQPTEVSLAKSHLKPVKVTMDLEPGLGHVSYTRGDGDCLIRAGSNKESMMKQ